MDEQTSGEQKHNKKFSVIFKLGLNPGMEFLVGVAFIILSSALLSAGFNGLLDAGLTILAFIIILDSIVTKVVRR